MSDNNKHFQPFIMVLTVTVILFVVSHVDSQFTMFGIKTKKVDLLSDILKKEELKTSSITAAITMDTIVSSKGIPLSPLGSSNIFDFKTDTTTSLAHFFQALNATKKSKHKTRIAYFGDSMIEGDLISQDLRNCMQEKFGGFGVGFVPITSIVAGFRASIIHSFDGWTTYNLIEKRPSDRLLGISGYGFVPDTLHYADTNNTSKGSWVNYAVVNRKHLNKFCETKLLYGKSSGENYVDINGTIYPLKGDNAVNQLEVNTVKDCQYINAEFYCKKPMDIFGFSMESDSGAFVDNFSFRGNSGMPITNVSQRVYSGTNACLGYDLIILEYGLNAVSPTITDFSWYEQGMNNVIKHMQASFPNASILLISVGDKSYRNNGVYETDPSVPILVEAQKRMAKNNKIAFWSLYDAMGGYGSMIKWVEGDTSLANKDYTHFNYRGAHKVGKLLFSKLMNEYNDYNAKKVN
jgi:hypothetical protein